jgi:ketosteroid isomerase-like protein
MSEAAEVVLAAFQAVEARDHEALVALYHPEVEFHEAPSLPYGGTSVGKAEVVADLGWLETWGPVQPTEAERQLDPRVIADDGREVVVIYTQRALDGAGNRFSSPVLGLYQVRDGRLARAQMFHFDTAAVLEFLARAEAGIS